MGIEKYWRIENIFELIADLVLSEYGWRIIFAKISPSKFGTSIFPISRYNFPYMYEFVSSIGASNFEVDFCSKEKLSRSEANLCKLWKSFDFLSNLIINSIVSYG